MSTLQNHLLETGRSSENEEITVEIMRDKTKELSIKETMKRYLSTTAYITVESLGYATPSCAARILKFPIVANPDG